MIHPIKARYDNGNGRSIRALGEADGPLARARVSGPGAGNPEGLAQRAVRRSGPYRKRDLITLMPSRDRSFGRSPIHHGRIFRFDGESSR